MIAGAEYNADLTQHIIRRTAEMSWQPTSHPGVSEKSLERLTDAKNARETGLLRFDAGAALPETALEERLEIFVLEGEISDGHASYGAGFYIRNPPGASIKLSSKTGVIILTKKRRGVGGGAPRMVCDINKRENWRSWGERGSEKVQLYDASEIKEASWVGYMLPDLHIPEHDHAGGEEIFVFEGEIEDHAGVAGPGTWMRFPIGFRHAPFSHARGCKMLVREGDVIA